MTKEDELVRRVLGRVAYQTAGGVAGDCCLTMADTTPLPRVAGLRRECPECGVTLKTVVVAAHAEARNDLVARGAGLVMAKERAARFRVAGVFVSKARYSVEDLARLDLEAGLAPGAARESEHGFWTGDAGGEGALLAPWERGVWLLLEEEAGNEAR